MTEEVCSKLIEEGYTQDQIEEIRQGQEENLDVSLYARKEYFAIQMRLIRQGMEAGLDVSRYAKPEYDWFQMEEIRLGLEHGVDVDVYADASITYDRMRQVRRGLEQGVNLSKYVKLEAGVIRQLRKAYIAKVNIIDYIKEGYTPEQIEEIRIGLEKGVAVKPYLMVEFRGMAIRQICEGLEDGLDVSVYAHPQYDWQQMQELRQGLENRLDVSIYAHPLYSWKQMREIRLGLEDGVDVSYYKSFMYTAPEMRKRRIQITEDSWDMETRLSGIPGEDEEKKEFTNFEVRVSEDDMAAYIVVTKGNTRISTKDLKQALRQAGVVQGIDEKAAELLKKGAEKGWEIKIAAGVAPQDGEDGWYEYFFRTNVERKPKILADGSVDYQSVEWYEMVTKGQKIATYHEPREGVHGYTVRGRILHAKNGREKRILTGKGFLVDEDKKTYTAAIDGKIELKGEQLEISRLLVIKEISLSSGNVSFDGSVYVTGDVGSGTRIEASEDVVVNGYVEDAIIECGGNVVLRKGMHAGGTGYIRAAGNIIGKFFESARVHATGDIQADYCMNCELYAEGRILITGNNGSLMGGTSCAVGGIEVDNLGNQAGIVTYVKLGMNDSVVKQMRSIEASMNSVDQELRILKNAYGDFMVKYPPEERNTMELFLKVESAIFTKEAEMDQLSLTKVQLEKAMKQMQEAKAVIKNTLYEGVVMEINGTRWYSKQVQAVTVKSINQRIAVYSNV